MNRLDIVKLCEQSHALAVEKGWYPDGKRDVDEALWLVVCELAEAFEEYRIDPSPEALRTIRYEPNGKPVGFAIELADAAIRLADLVGYQGKAATVAKEAVSYSASGDMPLASMMSDAAFDVLDGGTAQIKAAFCVIEKMAKRYGIDLAEAIRIKHAYNKTRPHRHGGRAA